MTDLSAITTLLCDQYSLRGLEPRDPAFMFRSLLVLVMTNPMMGITEWVNVHIARLVGWMMRLGTKKTDLPSDRLFQFFQENILSVSAHLGCLAIVSRLLLPAMALLSKLQPVLEVNLHVIAVPKALLSATIPEFIPNLIATQGGTAHVRNTVTVTIYI